MIEVVTDLTTTSGAGKNSVMYFTDITEPADAVASVQSFWANVGTGLVTAFRATVRTSGRRIDEATGELQGYYTAGVSQTTFGDVTGEAVADSTQALIRWRTGVVSGGREIRGRTYIPCVSVANVLGGNLRPTEQTRLATASDILTNPTTGFGVWKRPKDGAGGVFQPGPIDSDVWSEFAVLRRRRA